VFRKRYKVVNDNTKPIVWPLPFFYSGIGDVSKSGLVISETLCTAMLPYRLHTHNFKYLVGLKIIQDILNELYCVTVFQPQGPFGAPKVHKSWPTGLDHYQPISVFVTRHIKVHFKCLGLFSIQQPY